MRRHSVAVVPRSADPSMARPVLTLRPTFLCLIALLLACAGPVAAADTTATRVQVDQDELRSGDHVLHIQIAPDIDPDRARMLRAWLAETAQATLTAYGRFPLPDATIRVSEVDDRGSSPVPWGQTSRRNSVAVLLYVRKGASLAELRADWTAVHELSHLFIPTSVTTAAGWRRVWRATTRMCCARAAACWTRPRPGDVWMPVSAGAVARTVGCAWTNCPARATAPCACIGPAPPIGWKRIWRCANAAAASMPCFRATPIAA